MKIKDIELHNFRNYKFLKQDFNNQINIIIGNNAQGKSNLLESIYLLATSKSFRKYDDLDLIKINENECKITSEYIKNGSISKVSMSISRDYGKKTTINDKKTNKSSDYIGKINVTLFNPDDLMIIKGDSSLRRKYLDIVLCQTDRIYLNDLINYQKVIKNRNNILKFNRYDKINSILEPWDIQFYELSDKIVKKRIQLTDYLNNGIQKYAAAFNEHYDLAYLFTNLMLANPNEYKENLMSQHRVFYQQEINRKMTLLGPHRDDLLINMNSLNSRYYSSQDQQRTISFSLKMAETEYIREVVGEHPVLLLDDVFSELDEQRKGIILNGFKLPIQIFLTGTKVSDFSELREHSEVFKVESGTLTHV